MIEERIVTFDIFVLSDDLIDVYDGMNDLRETFGGCLPRYEFGVTDVSEPCFEIGLR